MQWAKYVFWISFSVIFYNYVGYAIITLVFNKLKKKSNQPHQEEYYPSVSFIVAAYNEEECIEKKIQNCFSLIYPSTLLEFIFITDGSTDKTPLLVAKYPQINLLHEANRSGKSAAINRAVEYAKNDILIFNDANTFLNSDAILKLTRHYKDDKIGGVSGEKKVLQLKENQHQTTNNEGLYWKYESFLKQIDSDFYSVVGAAGELFSVRKKLYEPVQPNVILDDFVISMQVAQKGYRILYEKNACASELPSASITDEQKRKVRIAAGGFQAIVMLKSMFRFWKHPRLFFLYFSHRVLRWAASPFCLILVFFSNLVLSFIAISWAWDVLFIIQLLFYFIALFASLFLPKRIGFKPAKFIYYFVFMNVSVLMGFIRFLRGSQSAVWDKVKRVNAS